MTVAEATPDLDIAADRNDRAFLGHPKGLGYLAFTEAWERFSYYGMQALLVLYLVNYLLHARQCRERRPVRAASARSTAAWTASRSPRPSSAPISPRVYLTPILGGFIADRLLGKRRTVLLGAITMARRPFPDGVRGELPVRLALPHPRLRHVQGQYRQPGRRALQARGPAPRRRLPDLLSRHQRRRHRRAADRRHARREDRLALGLRRGRRRHADRARHLPRRPEASADGAFRGPRPGRARRRAQAHPQGLAGRLSPWSC